MNEVNKLYITATPIGNLEDITLRALRILKEVDFILCEDTRVTKKLLNKYDIKTPTISYHQHSSEAKISEVIALLKEGKNLSLVTDAGTPGISDPGNELIEKVFKELGSDVDIVVVPGPSAVSAAASISGMPMSEFLFLGYPPKKKKRKKFFEKVVKSEAPIILYESTHRILKTLEELKEMFHVSGFMFQVMVARELTKKFESTYRGNIDEVINKLKDDKVKGEFVIIIRKLG
ncbi:MAG: 16S rRNA (cytidine(1402)-2'-O)-methyltransferase [Candidatus Spechtbacterales bacterium]